ncbi:MAG: response regulator [Pseudomonadota bacterium]
MEHRLTILLLEDEPLIAMDLEYAAQDRGCIVLPSNSCAGALALIEQQSEIHVAILDVSLGQDGTCFPVARVLDQRAIPYILHSGDLDRHNERIRQLDAKLIAKPAAAERVIAAAIMHAQGDDSGNEALAVE